MAKNRVDDGNQHRGDELSMDELTAEDWAALDRANDEVGQRWATGTETEVGMDAKDAEERADVAADILDSLGVEDI
jgi:hypothetical protein